MILVDEAMDPCYHGRSAQTVACCAVGVVFNIQHPGEGDAIATPAAAVGEEEVRLGGAGGFVGVREVVAAAD